MPRRRPLDGSARELMGRELRSDLRYGVFPAITAIPDGIAGLGLAVCVALKVSDSTMEHTDA